MKSLKSQVSVEYMIIIGILLVITIPVLYYAIIESNSNIKLNQADDAVNTIARAADNVYVLGQGSKNYVWITIPSGVSETSVGNNFVEIKLNIFGGVSDIYAVTKANVTGSLPSSKGTYKVLIEAVDNGQVAVFAYNDTTAPNVVSTSPSGNIKYNDTTLVAITNENSICRYDLADVDYDSMANTFSGTTFTHQDYVGELSEGSYLYYVRCSDSYGNNMSSSANISFTINLSADTTPPVVDNTSVDDTFLLIDGYICINTTAEDDVGIFGFPWVMITSPLDDPFIKIHNYSMSDSGPSCAGVDGDKIYGVDVQMQAVGTWYINTSYARDAEGNIGEEFPHPDIMINVTESVGGDLTYKPLTGEYHFSTSDLGLSDTAISPSDIFDDLGDDNQNTPSANEKFKLSSGGTYEGFIFELNEDKSMYSEIRIRIKSDSTTALPYNLVIYGYASNGDDVVLTGTTSMAITNVKGSGNRGENYAVITSTVMDSGYSKIKVRVAPAADMSTERADITEVDFGVG